MEKEDSMDILYGDFKYSPYQPDSQSEEQEGDETLQNETESMDQSYDMYGDLSDKESEVDSTFSEVPSKTGDSEMNTGSEKGVDDFDMYDDLLAQEDEEQKQSYQEKCQAYEMARKMVERLEEENKKLKQDLLKQTTICKNVEKNMSSLIVTARAEISRKDREITRLRRKPGLRSGNLPTNISQESSHSRKSETSSKQQKNYTSTSDTSYNSENNEKYLTSKDLRDKCRITSSGRPDREERIRQTDRLCSRQDDEEKSEVSGSEKYTADGEDSSFNSIYNDKCDRLRGNDQRRLIESDRRQHKSSDTDNRYSKVNSSRPSKHKDEIDESRSHRKEKPENKDENGSKSHRKEKHENKSDVENISHRKEKQDNKTESERKSHREERNENKNESRSRSNRDEKKLDDRDTRRKDLRSRLGVRNDRKNIAENEEKERVSDKLEQKLNKSNSVKNKNTEKENHTSSTKSQIVAKSHELKSRDNESGKESDDRRDQMRDHKDIDDKPTSERKDKDDKCESNDSGQTSGKIKENDSRHIETENTHSKTAVVPKVLDLREKLRLKRALEDKKKSQEEISNGKLDSCYETRERGLKICREEEVEQLRVKVSLKSTYLVERAHDNDSLKAKEVQQTDGVHDERNVKDQCISESYESNEKRIQQSSLSIKQRPSLVYKVSNRKDVDTELLKDKEFLETLKSNAKKKESPPHRSSSQSQNKCGIENKLPENKTRANTIQRSSINYDDLFAYSNSPSECSTLNPKNDKIDNTNKGIKVNDKIDDSNKDHEVVEKDSSFQNPNSSENIRDELPKVLGVDSGTKTDVFNAKYSETDHDSNYEGDCDDTQSDIDKTLNVSKETESKIDQNHQKVVSDSLSVSLNISQEQKCIDGTTTSNVDMQSPNGLDQAKTVKATQRRRSSEKKRRQSFRSVTSETISSFTSSEESPSVEEFVKSLRQEYENKSKNLSQTHSIDKDNDISENNSKLDKTSDVDHQVNSISPTKPLKKFCSKEGCQIKVNHLHPKSEMEQVQGHDTSMASVDQSDAESTNKTSNDDIKVLTETGIVPNDEGTCAIKCHVIDEKLSDKEIEGNTPSTGNENEEQLSNKSAVCKSGSAINPTSPAEDDQGMKRVPQPSYNRASFTPRGKGIVTVNSAHEDSSEDEGSDSESESSYTGSESSYSSYTSESSDEGSETESIGNHEMEINSNKGSSNEVIPGINESEIDAKDMTPMETELVVTEHESVTRPIQNLCDDNNINGETNQVESECHIVNQAHSDKLDKVNGEITELSTDQTASTDPTLKSSNIKIDGSGKDKPSSISELKKRILVVNENDVVQSDSLCSKILQEENILLPQKVPVLEKKSFLLESLLCGVTSVMEQKQKDMFIDKMNSKDEISKENTKFRIDLKLLNDGNQDKVDCIQLNVANNKTDHGHVKDETLKQLLSRKTVSCFQDGKVNSVLKDGIQHERDKTDSSAVTYHPNKAEVQTNASPVDIHTVNNDTKVVSKVDTVSYTDNSGLEEDIFGSQLSLTSEDDSDSGSSSSGSSSSGSSPGSSSGSDSDSESGSYSDTESHSSYSSSCSSPSRKQTKPNNADVIEQKIPDMEQTIPDMELEIPDSCEDAPESMDISCGESVIFNKSKLLTVAKECPPQKPKSILSVVSDCRQTGQIKEQQSKGLVSEQKTTNENSKGPDVVGNGNVELNTTVNSQSGQWLDVSLCDNPFVIQDELPQFVLDMPSKSKNSKKTKKKEIPFIQSSPVITISNDKISVQITDVPLLQNQKNEKASSDSNVQNSSSSNGGTFVDENKPDKIGNISGMEKKVSDRNSTQFIDSDKAKSGKLNDNNELDLQSNSLIEFADNSNQTIADRDKSYTMKENSTSGDECQNVEKRVLNDNVNTKTPVKSTPEKVDSNIPFDRDRSNQPEATSGHGKSNVSDQVLEKDKFRCLRPREIKSPSSSSGNETPVMKDKRRRVSKGTNELVNDCAQGKEKLKQGEEIDMKRKIYENRNSTRQLRSTTGDKTTHVVKQKDEKRIEKSPETSQTVCKAKTRPKGSIVVSKSDNSVSDSLLKPSSKSNETSDDKRIEKSPETIQTASKAKTCSKGNVVASNSDNSENRTILGLLKKGNGTSDEKRIEKSPETSQTVSKAKTSPKGNRVASNSDDSASGSILRLLGRSNETPKENTVKHRKTKVTSPKKKVRSSPLKSKSRVSESRSSTKSNLCDSRSSTKSNLCDSRSSTKSNLCESRRSTKSNLCESRRSTKSNVCDSISSTKSNLTFKLEPLKEFRDPCEELRKNLAKLTAHKINTLVTKEANKSIEGTVNKEVGLKSKTGSATKKASKSNKGSATTKGASKSKKGSVSKKETSKGTEGAVSKRKACPPKRVLSKAFISSDSDEESPGKIKKAKTDSQIDSIQKENIFDSKGKTTSPSSENMPPDDMLQNSLDPGSFENILENYENSLLNSKKVKLVKKKSIRKELKEDNVESNTSNSSSWENGTRKSAQLIDYDKTKTKKLNDNKETDLQRKDIEKITDKISRHVHTNNSDKTKPRKQMNAHKESDLQRKNVENKKDKVSKSEHLNDSDKTKPRKEVCDKDDTDLASKNNENHKLSKSVHSNDSGKTKAKNQLKDQNKPDITGTNFEKKKDNVSSSVKFLSDNGNNKPRKNVHESNLPSKNFEKKSDEISRSVQLNDSVTPKPRKQVNGNNKTDLLSKNVEKKSNNVSNSGQSNNSENNKPRKDIYNNKKSLPSKTSENTSGIAQKDPVLSNVSMDNDSGKPTIGLNIPQKDRYLSSHDIIEQDLMIESSDSDSYDSDSSGSDSSSTDSDSSTEEESDSDEMVKVIFGASDSSGGNRSKVVTEAKRLSMGPDGMQDEESQSEVVKNLDSKLMQLYSASREKCQVKSPNANSYLNELKSNVNENEISNPNSVGKEVVSVFHSRNIDPSIEHQVVCNTNKETDNVVIDDAKHSDKQNKAGEENDLKHSNDDFQFLSPRAKQTVSNTSTDSGQSVKSTPVETKATNNSDRPAGKSVVDILDLDTDTRDVIDYEDDISLGIDGSLDVSSGGSVGGGSAGSGNNECDKVTDILHESREEGEMSDNEDDNFVAIKDAKKVKDTITLSRNSTPRSNKSRATVSNDLAGSYSPIKFPSPSHIGNVAENGPDLRQQRKRYRGDSDSYSDGADRISGTAVKTDSNRSRDSKRSEKYETPLKSSPLVRRQRSRSPKRRRGSRSPVGRTSRRSYSVSPRRHRRSARSGLPPVSRRRRSVSRDRFRGDNTHRSKDRRSRRDSKDVSSSDENVDERRRRKGSALGRKRDRIESRDDSMSSAYDSPMDKHRSRRIREQERRRNRSGSFERRSRQTEGYKNSNKQKTLKKDLRLELSGQPAKQSSKHKRRYESSSDEEYVNVNDRKAEFKRRRGERSETPMCSSDSELDKAVKGAKESAEKGKNSSEKENVTTSITRRKDMTARKSVLERIA